MSSSSVSSNLNLGPLTTVWVPPSACTEAYIENSNNYGWLAQTCTTITGHYYAADNLDCRPPRSGLAKSYTQVPLNAFGYYSPGIACPAGYTTACSQTAGGNGNFNFNFPPSASETAYGCCPIGYFCTAQPIQTCISIATSTSFPTVQCVEGGITTGSVTAPMAVLETTTLEYDSESFSVDTESSLTYDIIVDHLSTSTSTSFESEVTIRAPLIQLVQKRSDKTNSTTTTKSTGTTSSLDSSSSASSVELTNSRLTGGAIAGAVIGALAGVGLLAFAGVCFFKARAKKNTTQGDAPGGAIELGYEAVNGDKVLMPDNQIYEAPAETGIQQSFIHLHEAPGAPIYRQAYDPRETGLIYELR